jgi:SpoVK/Ycf46/Vps4 family AAA+-type ATPase
VYEGVAVLATNLRQTLDEAFTRRLSFLVDFPFPEREYREKLWRSHFPQEAPLAADVNLYEVSDRFSLAGGNIRNAAIASAYLAAADGGAITMAHIRHAIRREHQKMGRLLESG